MASRGSMSDLVERVGRTEKRGDACEPLVHARALITDASVGSCDCNTKTNNPAYHMAYCRWLKLITALDKLDAVAEYINETIPTSKAEEA